MGEKSEVKRNEKKYGTPHRSNFIFMNALGTFYVIYMHIS